MGVAIYPQKRAARSIRRGISALLSQTLNPFTAI